MTKVISAYEARTNFGELLNQVYYQGEEILITKSGKTVAQLSRPKKGKKVGKKNADDLWAQMRAIAKKGRQVDGVAFLRKDRDSGHKIRS